MALVFILLLLAVLNVVNSEEPCKYSVILEPNEAYNVTPAKFSGGESCEWHVESTDENKLYLNCKYVHLRKNRKCSTEFIGVSRTGEMKTADETRFCGNGPVSSVSLENKMSVRLVTAGGGPGGNIQCIIIAQAPTTRESSDCGVLRDDEDHPYSMVAALLDPKSYKLLGAAVMITPKYFLTAAQSRDEEDEVIILFGSNDLGLDSRNASKLRIGHFILHPEYDSEAQLNDIAIVRATRPVTFTKRLGPACLPFLEQGVKFDGDSANLMSWSTSGENAFKLQTHDVSFMKFKRCNSKWKGNVANSQFCTEGEVDNLCSNAKGGPLFWTDNEGRFKVVGIFSKGPRKCEGHSTMIHSQVISYLHWIMQNVDDEISVK